jgi:hypothetical protein
MNQTIIRAPRRHRFLIIDQRAIEDDRLSWAARGLLGYLLSKPDDWKVLVNDLRKRGDLGRDGIYRLLRELRDAGYMRFVNIRDKHGRIRGGTYIVQEIETAPHPDLPDTVEPDTAEPYPVNTEALTTTEVNLRKTTTTKPNVTKGCCSSRENGNDSLEFADWVPHGLRAAAIKKVAGLNIGAAQMVIDEWAGIMATGRIESSPLGYLHTLINRFESGEFRLKYADEVARIRSSTKAPREITL